VVGIDRYPPGVGDLAYAVRDARAVRDLLEDELGFEVTALEDEEATRPRVLQEIVRVRQDLAFEDQFLIFFAGHGASFGEAGQEYCFLLPSDTETMDEDGVAASAIAMADLRDRLIKLPAKHVLVLVDACFSGCIAMRERGAGERREEFLERITRHPARQLITAGMRGETVREFDQK
jgi:uncharacterized caspase-like protein